MRVSVCAVRLWAMCERIRRQMWFTVILNTKFSGGKLHRRIFGELFPAKIGAVDLGVFRGFTGACTAKAPHFTPFSAEFWRL